MPEKFLSDIPRFLYHFSEDLFEMYLKMGERFGVT